MSKVTIIENITYNEALSESGKLDIYLPENAKGAPLLIYFHGGGLEAGDKADDRGMYLEVAEQGIIVVSPNYRMYPDYGFPAYLEDAAAAVACALKCVKEYADYGQVWIGGISAGGYISMMLHFAKDFLKNCGVDESLIHGYIFDAGQPTTHFNVLRERGMDTAAIRVDEAAPIYYLTEKYVANPQQKYLVICAENDFIGRPEQNQMMIKTMIAHGCEESRIDYKTMMGFTHAQYVGMQAEDGHYPYAVMIGEYILG